MTKFFIDSGVAATLFSLGNVSLGIPNTNLGWLGFLSPLVEKHVRALKSNYLVAWRWNESINKYLFFIKIYSYIYIQINL